MQPNATLVFQSCLRRNREAARFFDACTPGQKEAILSQLDKVEHMDAFLGPEPQARPDEGGGGGGWGPTPARVWSF